MESEDREVTETGGLPDFVRDPIGVLRRRRSWMLAVLLAGLVTTGLGLFLFEETYLAEATVLVSSQRIPEEFVRSTVEQDPFEKINAMVGESLTREKLAELVQKHGLYEGLLARRGMAAAAIRMREDIRIETKKGIEPLGSSSARLVTVAFESTRPDVASAVSNEIAGLFVAASIRMRTQQARLATDFLRREFERAERELREHGQKIAELKGKHQGELPADLEPTLRRLERLENQRQTLAFEITEAENRLAVLVAGGSTAEVPDSHEARLRALRTDLDQRLSVYTEEHPSVISLRVQIEALEAETSGSEHDSTPVSARAALLTASRRTIDELRKQLASTNRTLLELEDRVARIPGRQEELGALEERASALREDYMEGLRKLKDAELAEDLESAQQGEQISILEWAEPPTAPSFSRLKYLSAGIAASFAAALAVGVFLELTDPILVTIDQVEKVSGLTVLGSAPRMT